MIMRGDPADVRSVKEASEDLHKIVSLDAQFPASFDALFLTNTDDDLLETRPCHEPFDRENLHTPSSDFVSTYERDKFSWGNSFPIFSP